VDGTGLGSCPIMGFGTSGVEPWGSTTTVLLTLRSQFSFNRRTLILRFNQRQ
jgi:hypothetical protein